MNRFILLLGYTKFMTKGAIKMRARNIIGIVLFVVALTLFYQILLKVNVFSSSDPETDFNKAKVLLGDGRIDASISLLEKIIQENPGTDIAAECHFELAGIYGFMKRDSAKMLQEYQIVTDEKKGTPYSFEAEAYLVNCRYLNKDTFDEWLKEMNALLIKSGGVSIYDIFKSHNTKSNDYQNECDDDRDKCDNISNTQQEKWWETISSLSPEYRDSVIPAQYARVAGMLNGKDSCGYSNALKLHIFVRTFFPRYKGSGEEIESIKEMIYMEKKLVNRSHFQPDTKPPVINEITPHENHTIFNKKPKIEVELYDGDISQRQIDLSKVVFTLDGLDITDKMKVESHINTSGKLGIIFEKIRLKYYPPSPLFPGKHTVYIKSSDLKDQATEKDWNFITR